VDLAIVSVLGVISFFMRLHGFPIAPAILGIVLGPLIEQEFRRSLAISVGDPLIFVARPISAVILLAALVLFIAPMLRRWSHRLSIRP
jgi:putative tricarboxylic transport membrane protein